MQRRKKNCEAVKNCNETKFGMKIMKIDRNRKALKISDKPEEKIVKLKFVTLKAPETRKPP